MMMQIAPVAGAGAHGIVKSRTVSWPTGEDRGPVARIDRLSVTFGERLASLFTRVARRRILARPAGLRPPSPPHPCTGSVQAEPRMGRRGSQLPPRRTLPVVSTATHILTDGHATSLSMSGTPVWAQAWGPPAGRVELMMPTAPNAKHKEALVHAG
jgi:hypothetical protein